MLIVDGAESDGERAARLDADSWARTPYSVERQIKRARESLRFRRGLANEMLADFERENGLPPDRSERMIHAAGILLQTAASFGSGFNALTPPRIIQSRTCQIYFDASANPVFWETLAGLNPSPILIIRCGLARRLGLSVAIDSVGDGSLGSTKLKISFDNGATFPYSGATAFTTTSTITELFDNGDPNTGHTMNIWLSCAAGPYAADDAWEARVCSLADQSGQAGDRDLNNNTLATMFNYVPSSSAIRNRAYLQTDAARTTRFYSNYAAPTPAVGANTSFISWVINPNAFVNTGRIWAMSDGGAAALRQANPTPTVALAGNVAAMTNTQMIIGTWLGGEAALTNSVADRLKIGANASLTGTSCNSDAPTAFSLGARPGGALPSTVQIAGIGLWTGGEPTSAELIRNRAWKTVIYGVAA